MTRGLVVYESVFGDARTIAAAIAAGLSTAVPTDVVAAADAPAELGPDVTVLEWRLDPASDARIPEAGGYDVEVVVVRRQGYSSSLAAASLRAVGLHRTTDLEGGVEAWLAAGLPVSSRPADVRE